MDSVRLAQEIATLRQRIADLESRERLVVGNANPAALGVAAPGIDTEASREDHVHPLPSAGDVGAEPALGNPAADNYILSSSAVGVRLWVPRVSTATPQPLGTAAAGATGVASDAGHVHAMPTAAQTGVAQVRARLGKDTTQTGFAQTTFTKITWTDIVEEVGSGIGISLANNRITPATGVYVMEVNVLWDSTAMIAGQTMIISVFKNGSRLVDLPRLISPATGVFIGMGGTVFIVGNGTDYYEIYGWHDVSPNQAIYGEGLFVTTTWQIVRLA
jgi:hypothetical protein